MVSRVDCLLNRSRIARFIWVLASIGLLSLAIVSFGSLPSYAQTSSPIQRVFESQSPVSSPRSPLNIFQLGNLEYANVRLDGVSLFQVAAEVNLSLQEGELRPIEKRIILIENNLRQIVGSNFDPNQLVVNVEELDDDLAIFVEAEPNLARQLVLEVTELDAQLAGQSISSLADTRSEAILTGILSAKLERQRDNIVQQTYKSVFILFITIFISISIAFIQRKLLQRWKKTKQVGDLQQQTELTANMSGFEAHKSGLTWLQIAKPYDAEWQSIKLGRFNSLVRFLLRLSQVSIVFASVSFVFSLFPYTRGFSQWLFGFPLRFVGVIVLGFLAIRIINFCIDFIIEAWIDNQTFSGVKVSRHVKRAPSIALASKQMVSWITYSLVIAFVLVEIFRLPTLSILTGIGIAGLSLQSLLRDWINGLLILIEDQYALGDVIKFEDQLGIVEYLTLRTTKIRSLEGELISIANGRISKVNNLTSEWSRINLGINVEYSTDLEQAISVIESVALEMKKDRIFGSLILESPLVLGVDEFGQDFITIRILIKTLPMRQWDVAREYRLRLKVAFEEAGIKFSFPLKTIKMAP